MNESELKLAEFELAMKPATEWFDKNCNPHQKIIIESGFVSIISEDSGIPREVLD